MNRIRNQVFGAFENGGNPLEDFENLVDDEERIWTKAFSCRGTRYSRPTHGRMAVACMIAVHRNVVCHPNAWISAPPAAAEPDHLCG